MKTFNPWNLIITRVTVVITSLLISIPLVAQDEEKTPQDDDGMKPVKGTFESTWIIDNQTVLVPTKGTLEFMIQHRFGTVANGITDLWGLYAPSNIRLGMSYTLFDKVGFGIFKGPISIGIGSTKNNFVQDINIKYSLLQQTRNGKIPVSVSYYGTFGITTAEAKSDLPNGYTSDRYSFFNQIIIARQFSSKLSVQLAPSISHFNVVEKGMNNDLIAIALSTRFKISSQSSVIINVDQPITAMQSFNPQPNVSFGVEVATSAHAFQIFATCFNAIVPQYNNMYNQNDPWDSGFLLGFNITRLWSF